MDIIRTEHLTKIESFRDSFFDQSYPERYVKLFDRFSKNRTNLKLACIIAYLRAMCDNCAYIVYTGTYNHNQCEDAGYCFLKVEDINDINLSQSVVQNIVQSTVYSVFDKIKGYVVDAQGNVDRLVDFDRYILR